jgi:hypothetical protein
VREKNIQKLPGQLSGHNLFKKPRRKVKTLILIAETMSQAGGKHQEIYNMVIDTNCWWLLKYNILPHPNQKPSPNI